MIWRYIGEIGIHQKISDFADEICMIWQSNQKHTLFKSTDQSHKNNLSKYAAHEFLQSYILNFFIKKSQKNNVFYSDSA